MAVLLTFWKKAVASCDFCFWFNRKFRLMHIHLPETETEIEHVEGLYGQLGLPGCISSVDCVHICGSHAWQVFSPVARGKKDIQHWCSRTLFHIYEIFCLYLLFSLVLIMTRQLHNMIQLSW